LLSYYLAARELVCRFERVAFVHIPREKNTLADKLANQAMDGGSLKPGADAAQKLF
jgi:ribonuclease HI